MTDIEVIRALERIAYCLACVLDEQFSRSEYSAYSETVRNIIDDYEEARRE